MEQLCHEVIGSVNSHKQEFLSSVGKVFPCLEPYLEEILLRQFLVDFPPHKEGVMFCCHISLFPKISLFPI